MKKINNKNQNKKKNHFKHKILIKWLKNNINNHLKMVIIYKKNKIIKHLSRKNKKILLIIKMKKRVIKLKKYLN